MKGMGSVIRERNPYLARLRMTSNPPYPDAVEGIPFAHEINSTFVMILKEIGVLEGEWKKVDRRREIVQNIQHHAGQRSPLVGDSSTM